MSVYLIKTVETYRADSESEAKQLIEDAKGSSNYTLAKYASEHKELKSKGEVVDDWIRVTLTKVFTEEKEPQYQVIPTYSEEGAFSTDED